MKNNLSIPRICMNRDVEAVDFLMGRISIGEPSAVIGMADLGKDLIYSTLIEKVKANKYPYEISEYLVTTRNEFKTLLESLSISVNPSLLIINLSLTEDISEFVIQLDKLRLQKSNKIITIIISDLHCVTSAFENNIKILNRSLYILKPATMTDSFSLLQDFEERFQFKLNESQRDELYSLSTGYIGLLKSLFLLRKDYPDASFTDEFLLSQESIIYRLKKILNDLTKEKLESLVTREFDKSSLSYFKKFGYTENGVIKNKLIEAYILNYINPKSNLENEFTKTELTAYQYLTKNQNIIVSREKIAQEIWGPNWEERYSDWAIDQLIHKIREKLKKTHSSHQIVAKKGQGFIMNSKIVNS